MNVRDLAQRVPGTGPLPTGSPGAARPDAASQTAFADVLARVRETPAPGAAPALKLSAHAAQRVQQRGISFTDAEQASLQEAVQTLHARGAGEALLLRSDAAFVVHVPSGTVVTAVSPDELKTRVFTGIDSAVVL